jgi:hypothetical protein
MTRATLTRAPSGLFWTVPVPDDALRVSRDGRRAVLEAHDVPVIDSFQFFGPNQIPASLSLEFGFSFRSDVATTVDRGWAQIGRTRNGVFLS